MDKNNEGVGMNPTQPFYIQLTRDSFRRNTSMDTRGHWTYPD